MKFAKKKYRWIGILCFTLVLFWGLPVSASSFRQASITIFYHGVTPREERIALAEAEFILHKVGVCQDNKWKFEGDFAGCEVSLDDMSASGQLEAAKQIRKYAEIHQIQGNSQKTNQDGFLTFTGLENGLYLIVPGGEVTCGGDTFRSDAFLVQAPKIDELGNEIYKIIVEPKNEWVSDDKEPEERPEERPEEKPGDLSSKGEEVQTGDDTPVELLVKILAVSVIMIVLLIFWKNHDKKDKEELNE